MEGERSNEEVMKIELPRDAVTSANESKELVTKPSMNTVHVLNFVGKIFVV